MDQASVKDTIDRLPGGLLITDAQSKVLYANAAVGRRTGFAVGEIVGRKPGELWGGRMDRAFYREMWQTIGTEGRPYSGVARNARKDGVVHKERLFITPIRDGEGETRYFAEIRPDFASQADAQAFRDEFLDVAEGLHRESDPLAWILRVLGRRRDGTHTVAAKPEPRRGLSDLASLFRELLIAPVEALFARRSEDAVLIRKAQENPQAFARLYDKYRVPVREYFARRLGYDHELAEDLAQEVFALAFRRLPDFRLANASYYTYLLHIAHNVLVDHYRRRRVETVPFPIGGDFDRLLGGPNEVEGGDVGTLLRNLTEAERKIMLMKYGEGLKAREIGAKVGKTENAVKLILSRARRKARRALGA